ncbi:MAG: hypothetical protein E6J46_06830 [Chloroflexi bacterium]|nr:MAG: hypothetical protein E6J46_06830 [Chloroflexota bacterium]
MQTDDVNVWPAQLPPGARWLPYSPEPVRTSASNLPPIAPPPASVVRRPTPLVFWRLLLAAGLAAGFVGVLGGMAAAVLVGAR